MAQHLINPHSFVSGKTPETTSVEYGEIAVNCNSNDPFLSIKVATSATATGKIEKFSPDTVLDEKYFSQSDGTSLTAEVSKKAPTNHASTSTAYGVATTSNYGHVKISNGDVATTATADGVAAGMDHTHSNYVTSSGSVAYATEAGSADSAASATTAESAGYATEAGHAETADSATSATTAGSAASATTAGSATNATNLTSAPSLISASTTTIKVKAGNKESSAFTVPYAAKAGTADSAAQATNATNATTATNLAAKPSLAASGNNITVSAGNKTSDAFTVPYATKAGTADSAASATTAESATNATNATNAESANSAAQATKLTVSDTGSATQPVYFKNGVPVTCTTYANASVKSATSATTASKLSNTSAIGSNSQPVYFTSAGTPTVATAVTATTANSAAQATKLSTGDKGSATQPVYFDDGVPVACTYTLAKSVPADAVFTDTNTWRDISDSVSSTSSTVGASSKAVKTAYDRASSGVTAYNWGNHASAGYLKTSDYDSDQEGVAATLTDLADKVNEKSTVSISRNLTSGTKVGTITINGTGTDLYCQTNTDTKVTSVDNHYTPASSTTIGFTSGDNYIKGIRVDAKGHITAVVTGTPKDTNTDTDTHYTTRIYAGNSGTAANESATNPYLKVTDNNTYRNQVRFIGGGATSISSDASGNITISSTDNNTDTKVTSAANHYTPTSSTTLGFDSGDNYIKGLKLDSRGHITAVVTGTPKDTNTDTDTHHTAYLRTSSATTSTSNTTGTANGVYFNLVENGSVRSNTLVCGATNVTVTSPTAGTIVITGPNLSGYSTTSHTHSGYATTTALSNLSASIGETFVTGCVVTSASTATLVVDTPVSTVNGNCYLKLLDGNGAQQDYVRFYGLGGCKCFSSAGTIVVSAHTKTTNTDYNVASSYNSGTTSYIIGSTSSSSVTGVTTKCSIYMSGNTLHGCTGYYQDSDERLKTFHGEIPLDLEKLRKLPKAYFTWNGDEEGKMQIGTSAQKVRELYPEIVSGSDDTRLDVDYTKLAVIALRGIDVLYDELEKTRSEMETMKSELDVIKQKFGI